MMLQRELDAPDGLRQSIRGFWYREMDFGETPAAFEVLPDGHAEIVFHFGSGYGLRHHDTVDMLPSPFVVGLLREPIHFQAKGRLQIVGIKCLPWAVHDLLNLSTVKGGVNSITHPIAGLQGELNALLQSEKIDEALMCVRDWFVQNAESATPALAIQKAGQAMLDAQGSLPISSVAEAADTTVRTLERQFKATSGHTLKEVSGLIRFEQARDRLWEKPDSTISILAYELGYADQSHLNREFKRYSGMTAAAFAKQMAQHKKEIDTDFVAIVLSS